MPKNTIAYPGERAVPAKVYLAEQPGYTGKKYYRVHYAGQILNVHCADETAALFWAAKHWGYSFRRAEYHQNARVERLHYVPGR